VTFWSPDDMISSNAIPETNHQNMHTNSNVLSQNPEARHHTYSNYSNNEPSADAKLFKNEPDYVDTSNSIHSAETSSTSQQKKAKKEIDSSKPYKCAQCAYSFNRRDHLTRHSLVHSKLKPYHCNFCSKDFTRNDHLRRHQQRVHGEEGDIKFKSKSL
jgi:uncharacterized Zn-finger protein